MTTITSGDIVTVEKNIPAREIRRLKSTLFNRPYRRRFRSSARVPVRDCVYLYRTTHASLPSHVPSHYLPNPAGSRFTFSRPARSFISRPTQLQAPSLRARVQCVQCIRHDGVGLRSSENTGRSFFFFVSGRTNHFCRIYLSLSLLENLLIRNYFNVWTPYLLKLYRFSIL